MATLTHAVTGLRQALDAPMRADTWRWLVRHRLQAVTNALRDERATAGDVWLAARAGTVGREQVQLLDRIEVLAPMIQDSDDPRTVRSEVLRFLGDLEHHRRRMVDLAYDSVSLELGGSE